MNYRQHGRPESPPQPMPFSFRGADASSARAPRARCRDVIKFSNSRAERPAQGTALPHPRFGGIGKTKRHWPEGLPHRIVKICGITCEDDARVAVDAGANALGFNFYPKSPRYVTPERASEIIERVPGDYLRVGVFVVERAFSVADASLDVLQLHGDVNGFNVPRDYRVWRAVTAAAELPAENAFEALLLDSFTPHYGGSGKSFDWTLAKSLPHRILIAGGLDALNVAEAVRIARPWGVDACSRLESAPGKKDAARVRDFVRAALEALQVSEEIPS